MACEPRREAASTAGFDGVRRTLKVVALLAACALVGGLLSGERTLAACGAITLSSANAILILTRIDRAHETAARGSRRTVDIEPSAAWRAGARASIRIGVAIALVAITTAAVLDGEVLVSAAVAAIACAMAVFGGATWLAVVGEEEERAREATARSRVQRP